jgi:hypothetical protein
MRCYGVGWIKCRGGDGGENGILYLHMGEKEKLESYDRIWQWGSRAVGLIYDTENFTNGLYLKMRIQVSLLSDGRLCYLYMHQHIHR